MNIILEQAKRDMAEDGVCDVRALMDEIERLTNFMNKVAWHRGDEGSPDVPVLQPRYDALRQRVKDLEGRPIQLSEWQKMEAALVEASRRVSELESSATEAWAESMRQRVKVLEESEKLWVQQASDFARLADIAQRRADREVKLRMEQSEPESEGTCQEADGCPTEMAVLKRFWRDAQKEQREAVAWETGSGNGLIRYVTDSKYQKFSDTIKQYYRPYNRVTQPNSECEQLEQQVKVLEEKYDHAYDGWERECETANKLRAEIAELRSTQGEPVAYMLEHETGRLDLTFKVDEVHERLGWTHKVHELYSSASTSPDALRYQWLMGDCDGDAQDDIIRWLAGTVASKEEIDAKIDVAMNSSRELHR